MTGRRQLTPSAWSAVQAGLNELLLSPMVKRRAGIELRCTGVDADVVASGEMVDGRRREMFGGGCARDKSSPPYEPSHPPPRTARVVTGCGRVVVSFM